MSWEAIGAIGEVGGALAVVATLIYLAAQMKQNTGALHAASYEHWNTVTSSFSSFIAEYRNELSELDQFSDINDLSPEQFYLLAAHSERSIVQAETAFLLHRSGNMDSDVFEKRMGLLADYMNGHPILWEAWDVTKNLRADAFVTIIEEKRNPGGT